MMKRIGWFLGSLALAALTGSVATAHPGHGTGGDGNLSQQIVHNVTEPVHIVSLVLTVLVSGALAMLASQWVSSLQTPARHR